MVPGVISDNSTATWYVPLYPPIPDSFLDAGREIQRVREGRWRPYRGMYCAGRWF